MATAKGSQFRFSGCGGFVEEKISGSELIDGDFIAVGDGARKSSADRNFGRRLAYGMDTRREGAADSRGSCEVGNVQGCTGQIFQEILNPKCPVFASYRQRTFERRDFGGAMQNYQEQADAMHRTDCANVVAMPVSQPCTQDAPADSAMHDRLYRAATVATALLLLAGAAAA
jgi:hypothetical protein